MKKRLFALGVIALLCGCAALKHVVEPPDVSLAGIKPVSFNFSQQTLELQLKMENSNTFTLPIKAIDYVVKLNDKEFISGNSDERVDLPANGGATVPITVTLKTSEWFNLIKGLNLREGIRYNLSGGVSVANRSLRLPFTYSDDISLPFLSIK